MSIGIGAHKKLPVEIISLPAVTAYAQLVTEDGLVKESGLYYDRIIEKSDIRTA